MSMYELCERCDRRENHWNVHEYRIEIGELNRKPHLCDDCAVHVMSAVAVALRRPAGASSQSAEKEKKP